MLSLVILEKIVTIMIASNRNIQSTQHFNFKNDQSNLVQSTEVYTSYYTPEKNYYTYLTFSSSEINFSLSLKHCKEFKVERTSGSRSSTVGITDVYTNEQEKITKVNQFAAIRSIVASYTHPFLLILVLMNL